MEIYPNEPRIDCPTNLWQNMSKCTIFAPCVYVFADEWQCSTTLSVCSVRKFANRRYHSNELATLLTKIEPE